MRSKFFMICILLAVLPVRADGVAGGNEASSDRISELIEKLGHSNYAVRQSAQESLRLLGTAAFDALHEAQENDDVEIRLHKYLIQSTEIAWATEEDPREVRDALKDYQSQSEKERSLRIDRVAELDAIAPLSRIARFEPSEPLSKLAALALMRRKPKDVQDSLRRAELIVNEIQQSRRQAAGWLRQFAGEAKQATDLAAWTDVIEQEIRLLTISPEKTNRTVVQSLAKWHAQRLIDADLPEQQMAAMRRVIDVYDDSSSLRLLELMSWLGERDAWQLVVEAAERFDTMFQAQPLLLYRRAQAHMKLEQTDLADQFATQAFKLPARRAVRGNDPYDARVSRADYLERAGLIAWCKREYQKAIEDSNAADYEGYYARSRLSEIFHDEGQDNTAADHLDAILKATKQNSRVRTMIQQLLNRDENTIAVRMRYFRALHLEREGKLEESRKLLEQGIQMDPTDPDVLIAMYRSAEAPDEWTTKTKKRIETAAALIQTKIDSLQAVQSEDNRELANACNHYAWLVSNTIGDYQAALKQSQRSLELVPGSPELTDTLARCYYALKDFENAVKFQRQAYKKLSHSNQIRRQLELFEAALEESKEASSP